jgi:pimeloyl-ACP methyl ester carboxylesterase
MTITPVTTKIVTVSHLGGIDASTYMPAPYDPSKPTLVLCNSFGTGADLYRHQYQNAELNNLVNLLAIELLGHGQTRAKKTENFTYWDSAIMNIQVLDKLDIKGKVFVLGTSQGGWQTVRMALLAPDRVSEDHSYIWLTAIDGQNHTGRGYNTARYINGHRKRENSKARLLGCKKKPHSHD